ncbi:MAG: hypothetical protein FVQ79_00860 [Planctomycetes bacterium]|nr:hypothetical protein [Planctomycetota bacterium]
MKEGRLLKFAVGAAAAVVATGCRNNAPPDTGRIENGTYTNDFFKFSVSIPPGWNIAGDPTEEYLAEEGSDAVFWEGAPEGAYFINLLTVFQYPPDLEKTPNPGFCWMAEKIEKTPEPVTATKCLTAIKQYLTTSDIEASFPKGIYSVQLDKQNFEVMDVQLKTDNAIANQKYYVTIKKGYALFCIINTTETTKNAAIGKMIESANF